MESKYLAGCILGLYKCCETIKPFNGLMGLKQELEKLMVDGIYIEASGDKDSEGEPNLSVCYDGTVLMFTFGDIPYFQFKNDPITNLRTREEVSLQFIIAKLVELSRCFFMYIFMSILRVLTALRVYFHGKYTSNNIYPRCKYR